MLRVAIDYPEFRRIWLSQVVSQFGDWLSRVAVLGLIARLQGGGAVLGLGALYGMELALRLLPRAVVGPLAGSVADRIPRRCVMLSADYLRTGIVLALIAVERTGSLPLLYTLLVAQTATAIFFDAARSASIPSTVPREALQAAHALSAATWSALLAAGSLAGGVLVRSIGIPGTFAVDAGTYLVSAALLFRLRLPPLSRQPPPFDWRDVVLFRDLRRGLAHARRVRILPAVLAKTFWGFAGGYLVLLPIAAAQRLAPASAGGTRGDLAEEAAWITGLLYAARGIGTGVGPVAARRFLGTGDGALRRQIAGGFLVAGTLYVLFGLSRTVPAAFLCVAAAHTGGSALWVASTVLWQRHVEDAYRGRVYALEFLGMTTAFTAGGVAGGLLHDVSGSLTASVAALSAGVLASGLAWTGFARRALAPASPAPAVADPSATESASMSPAAPTSGAGHPPSRGARSPARETPGG